MCIFKILRFPRMYCFMLFCLISVCFFCHFKKKYESGIKIPGFRKLPKIQKKLKKEKKNVVHTVKCLKAKKSYHVFHTLEKNILACILALITSLLKSRENWPKFQ
jgi:hypothetical protein